MSRMICMERFAERAKGRVERVVAQLRPLATSLDVDVDPQMERVRETHALAPLRLPVRRDGDAPETYPSGV